MPEHDPLARRMVKCHAWVPGDKDKNTVGRCPSNRGCVRCMKGDMLTGLIPESYEDAYNRVKGIARWLASHATKIIDWGESADDTIAARLLAAEKEVDG